MKTEKITKSEKAFEYQYNDEISALNSQLVNMQRELTKKNAQLEKTNEIKNLFLGMVAHDLRNPISTIYTYGQFLLTGMSGIKQDEQLKFLEIIKSSSEFMLSLTDELLQISEIEAGKLELSHFWTDIVALIERIVSINKMLAKSKQIEITFCSEKDIFNVFVDIYKIEQVLNNLISNAVKFSNPGNIVEVELQKEEEYAVITVIDKGRGIPENEMDKLFKPFEKTSTKSTHGEKNTGLGLSIVKRIVEGHGGKITVKSRIGVGSSFMVHLPINRPDVIDTDKALIKAEEYVATTKERLNILVVEDSIVNSMAIERIANELGHTVVKAESGEEALNTMNTESINLVLMDVELSGINGLITCKLFRELDAKREQHTYIVGVSAHTSEQYKKKCINAGMDDYVTKPLSKSMLAFIIDSYVGFCNKTYNQKKDKSKNSADDDFNSFLFKVFFSEYPEKRVELERAIIDSDFSVLRKISHTLKSSLFYIGAKSASELASQIENSNSIDIARDTSRKLIKEIEVFKRYIENQL